jgi:hypothetical protein
LNYGAHSLSESVQDVRSQGARALEEIAENQDIYSGLGGNLLQGLAAGMNGAAQVSCAAEVPNHFICLLSRTLL